MGSPSNKPGSVGVGSRTAGKDPLVGLASFLHVSGPGAFEKHNGFLFECEEDKANIEKVMKKFNCDWKSSVNVQTNRHNFYSRSQSETIDHAVCD